MLLVFRCSDPLSTKPEQNFLFCARTARRLQTDAGTRSSFAEITPESDRTLRGQIASCRRMCGTKQVMCLVQFDRESDTNCVCINILCTFWFCFVFLFVSYRKVSNIWFCFRFPGCTSSTLFIAAVAYSSSI